MTDDLTKLKQQRGRDTVELADHSILNLNLGEILRTQAQNTQQETNEEVESEKGIQSLNLNLNGSGSTTNLSGLNFSNLNLGAISSSSERINNDDKRNNFVKQ